MMEVLKLVVVNILQIVLPWGLVSVPLNIVILSERQI